MGVKQAIKSLDAFPRAEEHLLQKTQSGALVSIVGLVIMATLFIHELKYYLTTYTVHQVDVIEVYCAKDKVETCLQAKCASLPARKNDRQSSGEPK